MSDSVSPARWSGATRVAAGIFGSRLLGLVRDQLVAYFFGVAGHQDVFRAVFRGPNILQNLLGEQSLSASFIPVYSRMVAEGRREEAGRFAGAVFGLLVAVAAAFALAGIFLARPIVLLLSPGYLGDAARVAGGEAEIDRLPLAVDAVRILFPMAALLVLSAWALGVLNSHRRFFVSYFAPVVWNISIIIALVVGARWFIEGGIAAAADAGPDARNALVLAACWGALAGGLLQFLFQLPLALRLMRGFRLSFSRRVEGVSEALRNLTPLLAARGAGQFSSYFDFVLASLLVSGAQAGLGQAQLLYFLPISLFALSVAAAELPELASLPAEERAVRGAERSQRALRRIVFWVMPAAVGYLAFGHLIVAALFRRGRFDLGANWLVYLVLCGYVVGLVATSWSRFLSNVFYAAGETKTPARIAIGRVALSAALGAALMLWLDRIPVGAVDSGLESPLRLGAVGLALAAGLSAWVELGLLARALPRKGLVARLPWKFAGRCFASALVSAAPATAVWWLTRSLPNEFAGPAVVGTFAAVYLGLGRLGGVPEVRFRRGPQTDDNGVRGGQP